METSFFQGTLVRSSRIIYTPSSFAKTNLIHLQEIGRLQAQQPHSSRRENLASYLFFLVSSGSGVLQYQGVTRELHQGDCVFLDCRSPYLHRSSEDLWSLQWIHFYGPNMSGIYQKYLERGGRPVFTPDSLDPYNTLIEETYRLADSSDYLKDMKIYEKLIGLLTLLMEESWNPGERRKGSAKGQSLQHIKDYLDQHYQEKVLLDDLAEQFYINKYYLTRIFREQFGITISNYLLQVRITHAKQLLRFSDLSVEAAGRECGIPDANYFSRIFRKIEGCSPGEYRKRW